MWYDAYRSPLLNVFDFFFIRIRQLFMWALTIGSVVVLHSDLLHLGEVWNDRLVLICLCLMALNHSVIEGK